MVLGVLGAGGSLLPDDAQTKNEWKQKQIRTM